MMVSSSRVEDRRGGHPGFIFPGMMADRMPGTCQLVTATYSTSNGQSRNNGS